jgi:hypothetical protein
MQKSFKKNFLKKGYVHLESVLSETEVSKLSELIRHPEKDSFVFDIDHLLKHPEIYSLQFNPKILSAIREVFGEQFQILNDVNIQVEQYYNDRSDKGWHIDAGGERLSKYLFDRDYGCAKIGVYLKENSVEFGGGIDVEIGGQKSFRFFGRSTVSYVISLAAYFFDRAFISHFRKKEMLQTKAGDVVIFDSRTPHRSTPRKRISDFNNRKVAIYWQTTRDQKNAQIYLAHSMRMAVSDKMNFSHYINFLGYRYPSDYPEGYVSLSKNERVNIASLSEIASTVYKKSVRLSNYEEYYFSEPMKND